MSGKVTGTGDSFTGKRVMHFVSRLWWRFPVRRRNRLKIKNLVFGRFGFLFRDTGMYVAWREAAVLSGQLDGEYDPVFPAGWPAPDNEGTLIQARPSPVIIDPRPIGSLALVVHVYYAELLDEILQSLDGASRFKCKLFVSGAEHNADEIVNCLSESGHEFEFAVSENRGRDILPFLKMSKTALEQGYRLLLKAHTKKADRRGSGRRWRQELYAALLPPEARDRATALFNEHHDMGMLGPAGHIVPMNLYLGANARAVGYLCRRLGVDTSALDGLGFVAGSMFYIRREALLPLLDLNLPDTIFEAEAGGRDGAMAHAFERAFSVSTFAAGMRLADTTFHATRRDPRMTDDHPFTW
jgi:lipopolysaccharide biosynthesis protein